MMNPLPEDLDFAVDIIAVCGVRLRHRIAESERKRGRYFFVGIEDEYPVVACLLYPALDLLAVARVLELKYF